MGVPALPHIRMSGIMRGSVDVSGLGLLALGFRRLFEHAGICRAISLTDVAGLPGAMLMRLLGPRYFVALTASSVRFLRPSKTTITGAVRIPPEEIEEIRRALEQDHAVERVFAVELIDTQGQLCCMVENTMHIARRRHEA